MLFNQTAETTEVVVTKDALVAEVQKLADNGYRFVILDTMEFEDNFQLMYQFGKAYDLTTMRLTVSKGEEVPSISSIFFNALLIENENQDLYGLKFKDLVVNFGGRLYLTEDAVEAPQSIAGMNVSLTKVYKQTSAKKEV